MSIVDIPKGATCIKCLQPVREGEAVNLEISRCFLSNSGERLWTCPQEDRTLVSHIVCPFPRNLHEKTNP